MKPTLYETETVLRKASIGVGLPFGLAEEIGLAAAWLAACSSDSVEPILEALRAGMSTAEMHVKEGGPLVFPNAHVAICGPSAIDFLVGDDTCVEVQLLDPDSAILLIGFAGVAARHHELEFLLSFSNGAEVRVSAGGWIEKGNVPISRCDIMLTCGKAGAAKSEISIPQRCLDFDVKSWEEAEMLAARTYVPESRKSRASGAGAGISDND